MKFINRNFCDKFLEFWYIYMCIYIYMNIYNILCMLVESRYSNFSQEVNHYMVSALSRPTWQLEYPYYLWSNLISTTLTVSYVGLNVMTAIE